MYTTDKKRFLPVPAKTFIGISFTLKYFSKTVKIITFPKDILDVSGKFLLTCKINYNWKYLNKMKNKSAMKSIQL